MESVIFLFMVVSMLAVFAVDTRHKRNKYLNKGK
jgi:hypothetical protein